MKSRKPPRPRPAYAWAIVDKFGDVWITPIHGLRSETIVEFEKFMALAWRKAYRKGYRCTRVVICPTTPRNSWY